MVYQIVVRASVESAHSVLDLGPCGDKDDGRDDLLAPELPHDGKAVLARHHQRRTRSHRRVVLRQPERFLAIGRDIHRVALGTQPRREVLGHPWVHLRQSGCA